MLLLNDNEKKILVVLPILHTLHNCPVVVFDYEVILQILFASRNAIQPIPNRYNIEQSNHTSEF